jgi:enterochelin esterase-like enzyme
LLGGGAQCSALDGRLVTPVTLVRPVTGETIRFSLYLPPGYDAGSARYPVVYHLHGIGGVHDNANQLNAVSQSHEQAVAAGRFAPAILVFPDGDKDSFWADSFDGSRRIETHVVREILPYVDTQYRTIASRQQRFIQGFSMGGFGAAKFAAKFPELFRAAVVYDGAMVDWSVVSKFHPTVAAAMFNQSEAIFDQYSPWHWTSQNAATLRDEVAFRQPVGSLVANNQNFRDHLTANGISTQYLETGCPHLLNCLLDAAGADSWSFFGEALGESCVAEANTLCLHGGRFQVASRWKGPDGQSGVGYAGQLTADTGTFWFFTPQNLELVIKTLDGCAANAHYWVFAAGLTDVEVELEVTDTETGTTKRYTSALGVPFAPIQDTRAFASCP